MFCFYGYKKEKQWGALSAPVGIAVVFDNIAGDAYSTAKAERVIPK